MPKALISVAFLLVLASPGALEARTFSVDTQADGRVAGGETSLILQGLLEQMDLDLPDEDKVPDITPTPDPPDDGNGDDEPQPDGDKETDDFFDDDGFFSDSDASFDEMKAAMDREFTETVSAWDQEYEETKARWAREREAFLDRVDEHRNATVAVAVLRSSAGEDARPPPTAKLAFEQMQPGEYHVVPGAMELPVRNQARRGTCAAFSGIRNVEAVLAQHGVKLDLSEEVFYWLSRPDCRPCGDGGSSIDGGFRVSSLAGAYSIPSESSCPYSSDTLNQLNVTHHTPRCVGNEFVAKVRDYVSFSRHDAVTDYLRNNYPVAAGFRLSPNFYTSKGLVTVSDALKAGQTDKHAAGHAVLLVGFIRLPETLRNEGRYCVIAANSWGDGSGRGGHLCLTEKWVQKYGFDRKGYAAIKTVEVDDTYLRNKGY